MESNEPTDDINIVFDKSHLLTIGERLYTSGIDLIRELVSNAYDADATSVAIAIESDAITVTDDGSGMDEGALRRYFIIGAQNKRKEPVSPRYRRERIGEFGIGKFSALTTARKFVVETQQVDVAFAGRVTFDSKAWEASPTSWTVPLERIAVTPEKENYTSITLTDIKKPLETSQVIKHIRDRLPVDAPNFSVLVNGNAITPPNIPGKRFSIRTITPHGLIHGEVILANLPPTRRNLSDAGVTIRVKGVAVCRDLFGFEGSHAIGVSRLRGSVHADFLPITSSRDNVILDSPEYLALHKTMREFIAVVLKDAREMVAQKENTQASRVLREALDRIGRALKRNPSAFTEPAVTPPIGAESRGVPDSDVQQNGAKNEHNEEGYSISRAQIVDVDDPTPGMDGTEKKFNEEADNENELSKKRRRHVGLAKRAVIRRMQFNNLGVICRMERFGHEQPPSVYEDGIIYLNIDHPLYKKQAHNDTLLSMFISQLLSKELALQKHPMNAREAFLLQQQILTDAIRHVKTL